ncbi:hypothetical protein ES703_62285 [subsurface metagenome]
MLTRLLALILLFSTLLSCSKSAEIIDISLAGERFRVEVARTPGQRQKGLMFRQSLGEREGMLFVFETDSRLSFWMKNTPLQLSLAFISSPGEILEIVDMEPRSLKSVRSKRSARYALELQLGTFTEIGAGVGDTVLFPSGFK